MNNYNLKFLFSKMQGILKKGTVEMLCISMISLLLLANCSKPKKSDDLEVKGTAWQLEGIVDVQTQNLKILEPGCYCFGFKEDKTISGCSPGNFVLGRWDYDGYFEAHIATMMGEPHEDAYLYISALHNVQKYTLIEGKIRLYYNENQNYLLYKQYKQIEQ